MNAADAIAWIDRSHHMVRALMPPPRITWTPPTVSIIAEWLARHIRVARASADGWRKAFPNGLRCSIHEDFVARGINGRCGKMVGQLRHDPFPGTITVLGEAGPIDFAFPAILDEDGLWRPVPGGICGFHMTPEAVEAGLRSGRWRIVRDAATGEVVLAKVDADELPTIRIEEWSGTCTMCGQCCGSRSTTDWLCAALTPPEG